MNLSKSISLPSIVTAKPGSLLYPKKLLLLVLIAAFLVRVYVSFFTSLLNIHTDSIDYFKQANALIEGSYINFFPNGYPFIVAFTKLVFGADNAVSLLLWMNICMSTLVVYFTYDIAQKLFGHQRIALLAAFIVAFFPSQINYVRWLMTEVPTTFFLLGAYYFYYNKKNWLSGLFLGIATLVRTEILPIFLLLVIADAFYHKKPNIKLLIGGIIPLIMLGSYCYKKTGEFSLAGHGKFNILASVTASGDHVDWTFPPKHPEINTSGKAVKLYMDTFKNAPGQFIKNRFANLWELWGFYASTTSGGREMAARIIIGLGNLFLVFFGLMAWWLNRGRYAVNIFMIPFIIVTIVHIVYFAMQRYTYPVEPFMLILAAWSINNYLNIFRNAVPKEKPAP